MKTIPENGRAENPLIIPVFIMNAGCPNLCIFCNERIAAGNFTTQITQSFFDSQIAAYLSWNKDKSRRVEIAFYGGNFTGLPPDCQARLLSWAGKYIRDKAAHAIRISTRPDYIDRETLDFLQSRFVRTVEIGVQSFNDDVLRLACRGHDAASARLAVRLLKENGFETGIHLMAGLPGDTKESFAQTLQVAASVKPDTARIHPVLVFKDTPLARQWQAGRYRPLSVEEALDWCTLAWEALVPAGIRIIRFGLQMTPEMSEAGAVLAGPVHPSLGSLVHAAVFYSAALKLLKNVPPQTRRLHFLVHPRDLSCFRGYRNENTQAIKKLYPDAEIVIDSGPGAMCGRLTAATETAGPFSVDIAGFH